MNIEKRKYWTKGNILGQFGRHMSGQPMIFPFCSIFTYFQYSLLHDLALNSQIILKQLLSSPNIFSSCSINPFLRKHNTNYMIAPKYQIVPRYEIVNYDASDVLSSASAS